MTCTISLILLILFIERVSYMPCVLYGDGESYKCIHSLIYSALFIELCSRHWAKCGDPKAKDPAGTL